MTERIFITELFGSGKDQKENRKKLLQGFALIIGSIFLAEGIMSLFPESLEKTGLVTLGLILILFSILD